MTNPVNDPRETWVFGPYELHVGGVPLRIPVTGKRPSIVDFVSGASYAWNSGQKRMEITIDPTSGSVPNTRKLLTPAESALTVNGDVEADLTGDVTFQVVVDPQSMKIAAGQVATLYPLSVTPDPQTISLRTFTGDAGPATTHGQGALLGVRFVAGTGDDAPAHSGALGVPKSTVGVAFRNNDDDADFSGLSHEVGDDGDTIAVGQHEDGPELDLRAHMRVRVTITSDNDPKDHSTLSGFYSGGPSGPIVEYSSDLGISVVHVVPEGGSFQVWEAGGTPTMRLFVDDDGTNIPAGATYKIDGVSISTEAERDSSVNPTAILTTDRVVYLDRPGGVTGATLPSAALMIGITITLINMSPDSGDDITVTADGSDKIGMGSSSTFTLHADGCLRLRGRSGRWAIVSYYDPENL